MLHCGDCLNILPTLPSASVDCVVTDPPYPHIKREYGYWTEAEWFALMDVVVPECRRILKPTGSAVFILQPNSERVGRMRTWLWDFLVKWGREWGVVQDAYWWNTTTPPNVHCHRDIGLTRPSVKACVWLGSEDCYRDQSAVLWGIAQATLAMKMGNRALKHKPSGYTSRDGRALATAIERDGAVPYNLLPIASNHANGSGANGHGGSTPLPLCEWWIRYLCPPGGSVFDPFSGSGTVPLAAEKLGRQWVAIEKEEKYVEIARRRLAQAHPPLFVGVP